MSNSRTLNAKRNIFAGVIKQFTNIILPFITRTIVIYTLGAQYQGLGGLFTSILQVLNLAELGFSTASTFILYEPIAKNDKVKICAIVSFLRKVYKIVAAVMLCGGILAMPFLKFIIKGDVPSDINIYILFMINLFNSTLSYAFWGYKSVVLTAMQREDIVSNIHTVTSFLTKALQLLVLIVLKSYYAYTLAFLLGTILNNVLVYLFSKRNFPDILPYGTIDSETADNLKKQIKALFIGKISDVSRNAFDIIAISTLMGLNSVAAYDNYYYILTAVSGVLGAVISAVQASVGSSVATETVEKNYGNFKTISFMWMWITGVCTVCFICLYQPFMHLWMGNKVEMILPFGSMCLFCLYFYVYCMNFIKNLYINAKGLFWECKKYYVLEAICNLILNFVLGYFWGISGVLIASILTMFVFNFICRVNILCDCYFTKKNAEIYKQYIIYFLCTLLACGITLFACTYINVYNDIITFVVRGCICITVPNLIMFAVLFKHPSYLNAKTMLKQIMRVKA